MPVVYLAERNVVLIPYKFEIIYIPTLQIFYKQLLLTNYPITTVISTI